MKILFCGNFKRESVGEPEIAYALEKEGHAVVRIPEDVTRGYIQEKIAGCDVFLYSKFRVKGAEEILREIKIPKICVLFDLYFGL